MNPDSSTPAASRTEPLYLERLSPSWTAHAAFLLVIPAVFLVVLAFKISEMLALVLAIVVWILAEAALLTMTKTIRIADGMLEAGRARIPLAQVGETTEYRGDAAFVARGRELDINAYMLLRPGIDPVLRIDVVDADDPVPYWLVSTRKPAELAEAITAGRDAGASAV